MVWLIVIAVIIILCMLPIGVSADYHAEGPTARLIIGPFRPMIYPRNKGNKQKTDRAASNEDNFASHKTVKKKSGGKLTDFLPILNLILDFLTDFRRRLRVRDLSLKLVLAGDDPCDLSVYYGSAWAILGSLLPILEKIFVIQNRNIEVECDYTADETLVDASIEISISVFGLLSVVIFHGTRILRQYYRLMKVKKDGAAL